jgi:hypothetical protein
LPGRVLVKPIDADAERFRLAEEPAGLAAATGAARFAKAAGMLRAEAVAAVRR